MLIWSKERSRLELHQSPMRAQAISRSAMVPIPPMTRAQAISRSAIMPITRAQASVSELGLRYGIHRPDHLWVLRIAYKVLFFESWLFSQLSDLRSRSKIILLGTVLDDLYQWMDECVCFREVAKSSLACVTILQFNDPFQPIIWWYLNQWPLILKVIITTAAASHWGLFFNLVIYVN